MVINEEKPITMSEVAALAGDSDKSQAIKDFIKKFNVLPIEKAKEMKEDLRKLNLIKLKEQYIVKVVDFMPKDAIELNKIIIEVSFDQEEITKILNVVKKY